MGIVPPVVSGVEAASHATSPMIGDLPVGDKIVIFATRWVNNLTAGFVGKDVFPTIQLSGQAQPHPVGNGWEKDSVPWLYTTLTGLIMTGVDYAVGRMTKSATRIAGVNITSN